MSGKKPYFPNNWKKYKDAPAELFEPHTFLEIVEWKLSAWELPSDVCCMIRATNIKTKKVKEHIYKRQHAAEAKVVEYMNKRTHEFVVCTDESIHYIHPSYIADDEESDI